MTSSRISINDPRLNWDKMPPIVSIDGFEYYLLEKYAANNRLQEIREDQKTYTPIMEISSMFNMPIFDFVCNGLLHREIGLLKDLDKMVVFSSFSKEERSVGFPYETRFLEPQRFYLINGLWHPSKDGEYEDVFCCMEMVPFACSIRFKSINHQTDNLSCPCALSFL